MKTTLNPADFEVVVTTPTDGAAVTQRFPVEGWTLSGATLRPVYDNGSGLNDESPESEVYLRSR